MNLQALGLLAEPPSIIEAFREGFASNSTVSSFLAILGGLALLIAVTGLAVRIQRRAQTPPQVDDPQALFEALLRMLNLTRLERRTLRRRVLELQLPQPGAVFLSPALFDRIVPAHTEIDAGRRDIPARTTERVLRRIRAALFGHGESSSVPGAATGA